MSYTTFRRAALFAAVFTVPVAAHAGDSVQDAPPTLKDVVGTPRYGFAETAETTKWAPVVERAPRARSAESANVAQRAEQADKAKRAEVARNSGQRTFGFCNPVNASKKTGSTYLGDILKNPKKFCSGTIDAIAKCGSLDGESLTFGEGAVSASSATVPSGENITVGAIVNTSGGSDASYSSREGVLRDMCTDQQSGTPLPEAASLFSYVPQESGNGSHVYSWTCQAENSNRVRSCRMTVELGCPGGITKQIDPTNGIKAMTVENGCIQSVTYQDGTKIGPNS